jgi:hypothetical protein
MLSRLTARLGRMQASWMMISLVPARSAASEDAILNARTSVRASPSVGVFPPFTPMMSTSVVSSVLVAAEI